MVDTRQQTARMQEINKMLAERETQQNENPSRTIQITKTKTREKKAFSLRFQNNKGKKKKTCDKMKIYINKTHS